MDYHEAADYLQSLQRRRPKLGTETTARMLTHLGDPQDGIDVVQIAGSNGKGSTARLLESTLRTAGLDVGLFTSPGLNDFREQVRINGRQVPQKRVVDFVKRIEPCIDRLADEDDEPTHFEVLTALAVDHFGRADVDVAILEVGIGGRYDATSAVDPVASAVTSVSLEHTDLLGETIEEIARDKAQVAPSDRPLVTGTTGDALAAVREETDVVTVGPADADVVAVERGMRSAVENDVSITGPDWSLETHLTLPGEHQATNAGVAATLARQVAAVEPETLATGLRKATWPGRFEIRSTEPMVVLDGSHNPGAMRTVDRLLDRYDYDDLTVVFGAMCDKAHEEMVAALPPIDTAIATRPAVDRAAETAELAAVLADGADSVREVPSVPEATEQAIAEAAADEFVLVTGSLYAVAEARDRWAQPLVPKDRHPDDGRGALSGAAFTGTDPDDVVTRRFATRLRVAQADQVAEHAAAAGVACHQSGDGCPEALTATVLSGPVPALRRLADRLDAAGHGLAVLAGQLRQSLDGTDAAPPLDGPETAVMGILNVTPDSFHDGGEYDRVADAVARAEAMVDRGADIVDVGGESTRPGADPVRPETEIQRVVPVIEALADLDIPVSVDTRKAAVADAALAAGADIVNDVSGLADPEMRFVVADHDATLILMHSRSVPVDPDHDPVYDDVVDDVLADLTETVLLAEQVGIDRERIVVDPGCGFGKTAAESFALVDRLSEFRALGCPVMLGHSRKSMFREISGPSEQRLPPTLAVTAMAAERGVDVVRVHDVAENAEALSAVDATR